MSTTWTVVAANPPIWSSPAGQDVRICADAHPIGAEARTCWMNDPTRACYLWTCVQVQGVITPPPGWPEGAKRGWERTDGTLVPWFLAADPAIGVGSTCLVGP